ASASPSLTHSPRNRTASSRLPSSTGFTARPGTPMTQEWHGSEFLWWARRVEPEGALAAFDAEVRRSVRADGSGARIEADPLVVRWVGAEGRGWSGIAWSRLADADAVIAAQVAYFAARDEKFEWKLYDYDRPADLGARLLAADFAAEGEESLMVT